jgi:hypothetical protein
LPRGNNELEICRLADYCKPYRFYCHLCGSEDHDTENHNNNSTGTTNSNISNNINNDNNDIYFPITITIMGHQSSQFNIEINLSMTVLSLKEKIHEYLKREDENLSTENLTLIHHGTIMQDKDLLGKYYITPKKYNELFLAFCFKEYILHYTMI